MENDILSHHKWLGYPKNTIYMTNYKDIAAMQKRISELTIKEMKDIRVITELVKLRRIIDDIMGIGRKVKNTFEL